MSAVEMVIERAHMVYAGFDGDVVITVINPAFGNRHVLRTSRVDAIRIARVGSADGWSEQVNTPCRETICVAYGHVVVRSIMQTDTIKHKSVCVIRRDEFRSRISQVRRLRSPRLLPPGIALAKNDFVASPVDHAVAHNGCVLDIVNANQRLARPTLRSRGSAASGNCIEISRIPRRIEGDSLIDQ